MKIALIHDYLTQFGGAERVINVLTELFPQAPLYTSIYSEKKMPENFRRMEIITSFMQKFPFAPSLFKAYFMFYPLAFESFDLASFDVILSSCSAYSKGVKKHKGQLHICYCHTPMRFVWRYDDYVKNETFPEWLKSLLPFLLEPIKKWDVENSRQVDYFIANSSVVAERIRQTYNRESVIIFPPVETKYFVPGAVNQDYYLIVSRLNHYKRIDLAIEAFNRLELPLVIIGDGPARSQLEKSAGRNIRFLGRLSDARTAKYLAECAALVFPGEEDFGIVPVEAMACGRPVIAFRAGGALDTVIDGKTGLFFYPQTAAALIEAVERFRFKIFDKSAVRERALLFDKENFKEKINKFIRDKYEARFGRKI